MKRSTNVSMWPSHQLQIICFGRSCQSRYLTGADRWLRDFSCWPTLANNQFFGGKVLVRFSITCRRCCNVVLRFQSMEERKTCHSNWCRCRVGGSHRLMLPRCWWAGRAIVYKTEWVHECGKLTSMWSRVSIFFDLHVAMFHHPSPSLLMIHHIFSHCPNLGMASEFGLPQLG